MSNAKSQKPNNGVGLVICSPLSASNVSFLLVSSELEINPGVIPKSIAFDKMVGLSQ